MMEVWRVEGRVLFDQRWTNESSIFGLTMGVGLIDSFIHSIVVRGATMAQVCRGDGQAGMAATFILRTSVDRSSQE